MNAHGSLGCSARGYLRFEVVRLKYLWQVKSDAFVVNVARGQIIDERALDGTLDPSLVVNAEVLRQE